MREFLNGILHEIGSESLTDDEFEALPEGLDSDFTKDVYDALKAVLQERDGVSGQLKKLHAYFVAKGVDVSGVEARNPASHIFLGAVLE